MSLRYSADVRLWFVLGEARFPLAQIGPHHIVFGESLELDACDGEVVMEVDGWARRWPVTLTDAVVPFDPSVRVRVR